MNFHAKPARKREDSWNAHLPRPPAVHPLSRRDGISPASSRLKFSCCVVFPRLVRLPDRIAQNTSRYHREKEARRRHRPLPRKPLHLPPQTAARAVSLPGQTLPFFGLVQLLRFNFVTGRPISSAVFEPSRVPGTVPSPVESHLSVSISTGNVGHVTRPGVGQAAEAVHT